MGKQIVLLLMVVVGLFMSLLMAEIGKSNDYPKWLTAIQAILLLATTFLVVLSIK